MEIEVEGVGLGEEHGRQLADPAAQQLLLMRLLAAIGVVGGETFLGQDVEAGEQSEGGVEIEVVDVAAPFLVQKLQRQQAQERAGRRDHVRAGIAGLLNEAVEAELGEHGPEQEDAGDARVPRLFGRPRQHSTIGDVGRGRPRGAGTAVRGRSAPWPIGKKGGAWSARH